MLISAWATVIAASLSIASARTPAAGPRHPLDPLTADEIRAAATLLTAAPQFPAGAQFAVIVLKEPPKSEVLNYTAGASFGRQAFAVILDGRGNRTFEAIVDLIAQRLTSWREVKNVQPRVLINEYEEAAKLVKADERWQSAMRKRGLNDFDQIYVEVWAAGQVPVALRGTRLLRALSYFHGGQKNPYGRPIEGVTALIDMNKNRVIDVTDGPIVPLAPQSQELDEQSIGRREATKPLVSTQPDGGSFTVDGQEIRWQKWRFRYAMHPREGLVLHTVAYEDRGRVRPILYRASLSEMVVPYADPDVNWRWRSAFDVGEYGAGRSASSIEPATDAPANATLVDATFADENGEPYVVQRAVGIHERDGGILWRHNETVAAQFLESRRARQLVVFFIVTIGNYDYVLNWIFHQDGTLEVDAALTGILLPKGVKETKMIGGARTFPHGHLVAPQIVAPHHQHFFNFRLDFDVDGANNSVYEMNTHAMSAPAANSLRGMTMETGLETERPAKRSVSMALARNWRVANPTVRSALGHNSSYLLVPGANSVPYAAPTIAARAGFIKNHFWVTRFNADEMNAAGMYPNQSVGGDGLPKWVANNERIVNEDIVVWYTMGVTHIPRPEEWPIMSVTHAGFKLIPAGFFEHNPALDVPKD